ncbi:hypothetical protein AVEN_194803-1 [Araneus ventricosus]|uniref:Uncharacterized protein n=1 Tax=Araneus ventricosus TaxID=182803 RepID=A0A4Y2B5F9_ARAVE|nr:hypothetical protein AVEN_194803-1 [Araneus ventricosus]
MESISSLEPSGTEAKNQRSGRHGMRPRFETTEKEELQGMLPVDSRQLGNVKEELLKLTKKETADCQHKKKNKEIANCQTWHNVARREDPKKTEEQRNSRLVRQDVSRDLKE